MIALVDAINYQTPVTQLKEVPLLS